MRFLAAVDTVHVAAAICDYLGDRVEPGDAVHAVAVHPGAADGGDAAEEANPAASGGDGGDRDREEALNVVRVRLAVPAVETAVRRGDPAAELLAAADQEAVDEIVLCAGVGAAEEAAGLGSTAAAVAASSDRPVVVVPAPQQ